MATSFEAVIDTTAAGAAPDWVKRLQASTGFVANDWQTCGNPPKDETQGRDAALAAAYQDGEAAGRAAMAAELAESNSAQSRLKLAIDGFNAEASEAVRLALADTVAAICEQVIEPALIDRAALNQRCQQAIEKLGQAPAQMTLHVHPDDLPLLAQPDETGPRLVADASLSRGAIRLESAEGIVSDGPDEWRRMLREALGQ